MERHILSLQRKASYSNDLLLHSQFPLLLRHIIVTQFNNGNGKPLSFSPVFFPILSFYSFLWSILSLWHKIVFNLTEAFFLYRKGVVMKPNAEWENGCHGKFWRKHLISVKLKTIKCIWNLSRRQSCRNKQQPGGSPLCSRLTVSSFLSKRFYVYFASWWCSWRVISILCFLFKAYWARCLKYSIIISKVTLQHPAGHLGCILSHQ